MGFTMEDSQVIEKLGDMAESLAGINCTLKSMEKRIDSIDMRVAKLEEKPSQTLTLIYGAIISAVIAAIIKFLF